MRSQDTFSVRWIEFFMTLAHVNATMSKDPSTKVGAVIVRPDKTVVSMGFNGFPRCTKDNPDYLNNRAEKYPRMIHAEMNAILVAKESLRGCTLFCSHPVCDRCMPHIAQTGIDTVYQLRPSADFLNRWKDSADMAKQIAHDNAILVVNLEPGLKWLV